MRKQLKPQLEQYTGVAQGILKLNPHRTITPSKLSMYAAAGAALGMAWNAEATLIYSGVLNKTALLSNNQSTGYTDSLIDIDGGGADLRLLLTRIYYDRGQVLFLPLNGKIFATGQSVLKLASGSTISSGMNALLVNSLKIIAGADFGVPNAGLFTFGATGIAGFQLGNNNYGWIRLKPEFSSLSGKPVIARGFTVIDWAYEDSGASILAGDTGLPDEIKNNTIALPHPLSLLAAGAMGVAAFRRRNKALHAGNTTKTEHS